MKKKDKLYVDKMLKECMEIQGVDKIEDLEWVMLSKTVTKKELKKMYPDYSMKNLKKEEKPWGTPFLSAFLTAWKKSMEKK